MITENLSTLKIHKIPQEKYKREYENNKINAGEFYLTPDDRLVINFNRNGATTVCDKSFDEISSALHRGYEVIVTYIDEDEFAYQTSTVRQDGWETIVFDFSSFKILLDAGEGVAVNRGGYVDLSGYVKSVNGVTPDENGNVQIETGGVSAEGADAKYFDIDYDGLISLKPEYRGDATQTYSTNYPFSKSDNGVGAEGSKISELPECIVIPHNVDGENVTGFKPGTFCHNRRIKKVVLPTSIYAIANGTFRDAIYLEKVENTEQIETIGTGAFHSTRIEEIRFPNLVSLGNLGFQNCSCLRLIDIGQITSVPKQTFYCCENLENVLGGENVTTVGDMACWATRRLKELSFLPNVTSIGKSAFFSSRCNVEKVADGCTFGESATYKQFNAPDYWSGVTFTPCKNPLNSLFHQKDPRWAENQIGSYTAEDGTPYTYGKNGCAFITLAEIYSAFEGVHFDSPEEFAPILESKGLTHLDFRYRDQWCLIAKGLGYDAEYITTMTQADLQNVYDALEQGALIYKSVAAAGDTGITPYGGHATLCYGINTEGEILTSDTSMHCYNIGIYKNHKTAWHIYKQGNEQCDCVIVRKR